MAGYYRIALAITTGCLMFQAAGFAQVPSMPPKPEVKDDGTIVVPSFELPFSSFASSEAAAEFVRRVRTPMPMVPDLKKMRQYVDEGARKIIAQDARLFPYSSTKAMMGGVPVESFVPTAGIAPENKNRVLINVHGGAFIAGGGGPGGAIESIPIAGVGRIRVVSVDYRLGPENKFPAASEDLASVYRELLKTYRPENIGIYGCSAGGALAAQAIPWFLKEKLPLPGALGIFCASTHKFGGGDSYQIWPRLGSVIPIVPSAKFSDERFDGPDAGYFGAATPRDPLAVPSASKDVLKAFPSTLFLTGTRAPDMSSAVESHMELVELGVDSQLLLFDGMDHGFFSDPNMPESTRAYRLITHFFSTHLGVTKPRKP